MWVMTTVHDDSDPGDHAYVEKVRIFKSLDGLREAFGQLRTMYLIDHDESDFPETDDYTVMCEMARRSPEAYTWCSRDTRQDFGWDGGTLIWFDYTEVEP